MNEALRSIFLYGKMFSKDMACSVHCYFLKFVINRDIPCDVTKYVACFCFFFVFSVKSDLEHSRKRYTKTVHENGTRKRYTKMVQNIRKITTDLRSGHLITSNSKITIFTGEAL